MLSNAQYSDHCMVELLKEHSTTGVSYSQPLSAQAQQARKINPSSD